MPSIPEPDGRLIPAAGQRVTIRGEGHVQHALDWPNSPERNATLYVPQLEAAIQAPADQRAFVRAKSERHHNVRMRLPDQVQGLARLLLHPPYPYFPAFTTRSPVPPTSADGDRPDGIEGFGKDALTEQRPSQACILQLDPLQEGTANAELRQIQPAQLATKFAQQRQQVRRSIALSIVSPGAQ